MRRAALDFMTQPRPPVLGAFLFVAGMVAMASAWWLSEHWGLERAIAERAAQQSATAREASRPKLAPTMVTPQQRRHQQAQAELGRPWLPVLRAIEAATRDPVFLLALAIEPGTGAIRLEAEASTFDQALAYVESLADAEALTGVALVAHEAVPSPAPLQGAIRFSVSARWAMP